ncbi:hypothetical protein GEV33_005863 [Tenebrio molitor]|uniref:Chitin-binding type-2 domain-containing protein n=1 Tax=Tenebrio molitor TaxID=7067 RepID=A0A8J6HME5_TENMO|nr:hypothetical protein GEV33_005863 [Tenebrio molitor]
MNVRVLARKRLKHVRAYKKSVKLLNLALPENKSVYLDYDSIILDPLCAGYPHDEEVFFESVLDCAQYYKCFNGTFSIEECSDGLFFSENNKGCVSPEYAECKGGSGSPTESTTTDPTTTPTTSKYSTKFNNNFDGNNNINAGNNNGNHNGNHNGNNNGNNNNGNNNSGNNNNGNNNNGNNISTNNNRDDTR